MKKPRNILTPPGTEHKSPAWFKWLLLFFLIYASGRALLHDGDPTKRLENAEDFATRQQVNIENVAHQLIPEFDPLVYAKDIKEGAGAALYCGQQFRLRYDSFLYEKGTLLEKGREISFRLGDPAAMPALNQSLAGMRVDGVRSIVAPYEKSYGAPRQEKPAMPADSGRIRLEVTLLEVSPEIRITGMKLKTFDDRAVLGEPLQCGDAARLNVTLWAVDGRELYRSAEPLAVRLGEGRLIFGLEQSLPGMTPGSQRTLIIPPAYQFSIEGRETGKNDALPIALPGKEAVIAEIRVLRPR